MEGRGSYIFSKQQIKAVIGTDHSSGVSNSKASRNHNALLTTGEAGSFSLQNHLLTENKENWVYLEFPGKAIWESGHSNYLDFFFKVFQDDAWLSCYMCELLVRHCFQDDAWLSCYMCELLVRPCWCQLKLSCSVRMD